MTVDLLGPASAGSVTSRPARSNTRGSTNTWFKDCSSPTANDGTEYDADYFNDTLAQLRTVFTSAGIVLDNNDDMLWRAIQQMGIRYANDSGTANAVIVTNTPPVPAYRAGLALAVKLANDITAAATINVDALGVKNIVSISGRALSGGEASAGDVVLLIEDDSSQFRMVGHRPKLLTGIVNLSGSAAGGAKTASFTIESVIAATSARAVFRGDSLSLSFNGATTGANGMDTGATPTSADLSIYAIFNPTTGTWACLGCAGSTSNGTVYAGAHMPSGYTASRLIWAGVTNGSGQIAAFQQFDRTVWVASSNFVTATPAPTSPTAVSVATVVPAIGKSIAGNVNLNTGSGAVFLAGTAGSGSGGSGMIGLQWFATVGVDINFGFVPVVSGQQVFYYASAGSVGVSIAIDSYTF